MGNFLFKGDNCRKLHLGKFLGEGTIISYREAVPITKAGGGSVVGRFERERFRGGRMHR